MNDKKPKRRWGFVLPYIAGAAVCLLAGLSALTGFEWCGSLALFCVGLIFVVGRRLIVRVGVQRAGDEIICRYRPLLEGSTYLWAIVMPTLGVSIVACGFIPGNPVWWRFGGVFIFLLCPLMVFGFVRMGRRALLGVTPSTLKVRGSAYVGEGAAITEIHRDLVQAIEPRRVGRWNWLQVAVVYRVESTSGEPHTFTLGAYGTQVSVQPIDVLNGLTAWKDGVGDDPSERLDQIERILRGHSTASA